ncbi:MAG: 3'-5' exoribonuclease YhaM family protein [Planctomycetota bacterium]
MASAAPKTVRELAPGDAVDRALLVREASLATTRNGKPYLRATLADRTGEISAIQFDVAEDCLGQFPAGGYVRVRGTAESYKGKVNLKLKAARAAEPAEVDPADFEVVTERDVKELRKGLTKLVRSVKEPDLARLLGAFFDDKTWRARFERAPGATSYHHACVGGLMEHTVDVASAADAVAAANSRLRRDLLVAGALLHDIGKMDELSPDAGFDRTDAGNFIGHITIGALAVDAKLKELGGFPETLRLEVLHLLLSHHGQKEWGSPVLPATPEALALHHLDNLDAKVQAADAASRAPAAEGARWSEFNRMLGVRVWRAGAEGAGDA